MLEGLRWEEGGADYGSDGTSYLEEEVRLMLAKYERLLFGGDNGGGGTGGSLSGREQSRLECRHRMMERWERMRGQAHQHVHTIDV